MKRSRYISFLLAALMLFTAFAFPFYTSAAIDLSGHYLTTGQKYFLRVIGSLSRADYYETDVLASVTLAQAIYEGGWGRYSLPVGGCNLFGIKAFSAWEGMVYDQSTSMLYASYDDFLFAEGQSHLNTVSAWRAHESWAESVSVHSSLFLNESKYAAVIGEKDYKTATQAIVDAGYCDDDGYVQTVVNLIEQYGLTEYDDITPDEDGVVTVVTKQERKLLSVGETYTVPLTYYPESSVPSSVTWESDDTSVATVDENGNVTAVSHGMTLITATLANGREAACIVYVDCNATVIDKDAEIFVTPSANASTNGKIYRGNALKVMDTSVYTDSDGNRFYKVSGYNSKGTLVSGYALEEYVYLNERYVSKIAVVKDSLTIKRGDTYAVKTAVAPADAVDTTLTWASSNTAVATVDANGVINAKSNGTAVITAKALGGAECSINVTVASDYRNYNALVSAYETLTVRSEPNTSASRVGTLNFLSEVTVIGEAEGAWYKISGKNSSGKTVTGYANSAYIRIIDDNFTVIYGTAPANITVYADSDTSSKSYNKLAEGTQYAVIGETDGDWKYVVGLKTPSNLSAVHGYALLDSESDPNQGTTTPDTPVLGGDSYYGRTTADLYVRSGAGTGYDAVGKFGEGAQIVISGDATNGWYKVSGTDKDGNSVSGYSSATYIIILYSATVNATTLNVRSTPSTSGAVVAQFSNGTEIIVVGEASDGWYSVESTDGTVKGYCSADYITVNGKLGAQVSTGEGFGITDSKLSITDGILYGVALDTTVSELLACFTGDVAVTDASGNVLAGNKLVGTNCRISVTADGKTSDVATVLIMGDADGDGTVTSFDYLLVKRHFLGSYELKGLCYEAALVSGEEELNIIDYVFIKRHYFGTYKIQ